MTKEKIREVLTIYQKKIEELSIPKEPFTQNSYAISDIQCLAHCHEMLNEMEIFIQEKRMEKVFRWLGFIQGCLWKAGIYTIEELKNHSRPK